MTPDTVIQSRYIINWGSNTSVTNMHLWTIMHRAQSRRKIVSIDPFRCKTAEKSDWWIPIRPGTDAALALGMMHILWRDSLQDDDYLQKHCLGVTELRERVLAEYNPARVARITGIAEADMEKLTHEYATIRPALIRVNYGMQRHGGGGMAVRAITCLPAIIGAWRRPGGGAAAQRNCSKLYPFDSAALERPDLIPPGTRTINMVQLAEALLGGSCLAHRSGRSTSTTPTPPPGLSRSEPGCSRDCGAEDLFTVVHEQFQTDTADYADIVLPATTQLEHFDIHGSYGHLHVQTNEPAIAPLEEAKSNNDVFRLLARKMGFEPDLFEINDERLAEQSLGLHDGNTQSAGSDLQSPRYPPPQGFVGLSVARLKAEGPIRLNVPRNYAPFAEGNFGTPSGKCEFYSPALARRGLDPLPNYTPPHEDPQTRPELAAEGIRCK